MSCSVHSRARTETSWCDLPEDQPPPLGGWLFFFLSLFLSRFDGIKFNNFVITLIFPFYRQDTPIQRNLVVSDLEKLDYLLDLLFLFPVIVTAHTMLQISSSRFAPRQSLRRWTAHFIPKRQTGDLAALLLSRSASSKSNHAAI